MLLDFAMSHANELKELGLGKEANAKPDAANKARISMARRFVGEQAITTGTRPEYVLTKRRRDPETGEYKDIEYISRPLLALDIMEQEHFMFVETTNGQALPYQYHSGVYREISDRHIHNTVQRYICAWDPLILNQKDVQEVVKTVSNGAALHRMDELNRDERTVNFRNCLYDPFTMEIRPHTPDYLSTIQLPFNFPMDIDMKSGNVWAELQARTPTFWKEVNYLAYGPANNPNPDSGNRVEFLMEWMAVCLSNVNGGKFKKSLWMFGPGNSGKSIVNDIEIRLIADKE